MSLSNTFIYEGPAREALRSPNLYRRYGMKRMVLIAFMVFCSLLFLGEEKASAIPYTFTWDVNGFMNGRNLGTGDTSSWYATFLIESTDLSWSDSWGSSGTIQNASGDKAYNIDFFNAVTYDLDCGKTYTVDCRIHAGAHVEDGQAGFEWEIDGQMDKTGSFLWLTRENSVSGNVSDSLGSDSYSQSHPVPTADSGSYGMMTVESSALMDTLNAKGNVALNPNVYFSDGYSEAVFSGSFEVIPDVLPAPGGLMLAAVGIGIVGWLRGRRTL